MQAVERLGIQQNMKTSFIRNARIAWQAPCVYHHENDSFVFRHSQTIFESVPLTVVETQKPPSFREAEIQRFLNILSPTARYASPSVVLVCKKVHPFGCIVKAIKNEQLLALHKLVAQGLKSLNPNFLGGTIH